MAEIRKCTASCKSEYQDALYGEGNRVMNATLGRGTGGFRCTVCRIKQG